MSKVSTMMNIGKQSLMNNQTALQTVAHNISNKSTEGYSRQRVDFEAMAPTSMGNVQIGSGARVREVQSIKNEFLDKQIQGENGKLGYDKSRSEALGRVEQVYNEQINKGLNRFVGEFFNSWRELANSPENRSARTQVKETANFMVKDFKRINNQLKDIKNDFDFQIKGEVLEINAAAKEIATLNEKITMAESNGSKANDLRDQRTNVLKKLGEKVNIRYNENQFGQINVTVGDTGLMVSGYEHGELRVMDSPEKGAKREGNLDVVFRLGDNKTDFVITDQLKGGSVGALIDVRDHVVNDNLDRIDQVAYNLAMNVNKLHIEGFDRYSKQGVLFFEMPDKIRDASQKIELNQTIANDVGRIVAARTQHSPGDNRLANDIVGLQDKRVMEDQTSTINDYYNSMVGQVGVYAKKANDVFSHQQNIVGQLKNLRESISGVSLDEETVKMVEFQKTFDASAKLIKTADEMMNTVLSLKQ